MPGARIVRDRRAARVGTGVTSSLPPMWSSSRNRWPRLVKSSRWAFEVSQVTNTESANLTDGALRVSVTHAPATPVRQQASGWVLGSAAPCIGTRCFLAAVESVLRGLPIPYDNGGATAREPPDLGVVLLSAQVSVPYRRLGVPPRSVPHRVAQVVERVPCVRVL